MIKLKPIVQSIHEITRKEAVLELSRGIINAFKAGKSQYTSELDLFLAATGWESEAEVDLVVTFEEVGEEAGYAFSIGASAENSTLEMHIEYYPAGFPQAMSAFVAEVKETLEHELEHFGQDGFEQLYVQSNSYDEPLRYPEASPQAPTHELYLISNREVPAYVKGLLKRAKVKRMSFDEVLEDYYNDNKLVFDRHNTNWNKVKSVWMDWYNKHKDVPGRLLKRVKDS
jgi:hypothetical protein